MSKRMVAHTGSILLLVLVFGSIFFIILGALVQLVLTENRAQDALIGKAQSFTIAEAGLEYYAWFLSQFPGDFTHGTGNSGPYVINYTDPEGATIGTHSLSVEGSSACGSMQTVDITSTGTSTAFPGFITTLVGRYAAPSVAAYREIVEGVSSIDFTTITPDFIALKAIAQAEGILLPQHEVPQSPHLGYHLVFNEDGTVTVTLVVAVTTLRSVQAVNNPGRSMNDYTLIQSEEPYQTFSIPSDCGLIYVEDNTWIEGVITNKVTLVVSTQGGGGAAPDVILHDDLTYASDDGTDGLTVLAEHNIIIAPDSPMNLTLHGIFVATLGYFGRNYYYYPSSGCNGLYEPRGALTILGTIVSNYPPATSWPNGCPGGNKAGYQTQSLSVDTDNATNPPAHTPTTSQNRTFVNWQQIR